MLAVVVVIAKSVLFAAITCFRPLLYTVQPVHLSDALLVALVDPRYTLQGPALDSVEVIPARSPGVGPLSGTTPNNRAFKPSVLAISSHCGVPAVLLQNLRLFEEELVLKYIAPTFDAAQVAVSAYVEN